MRNAVTQFAEQEKGFYGTRALRQWDLTSDETLSIGDLSRILAFKGIGLIMGESYHYASGLPPMEMPRTQFHMEQIIYPSEVIPWWQRKPDTYSKHVHILCTNGRQYGKNRHAHVFLRDGYVQYDVYEEYFTGVQSELPCIPARANKYEKYKIQREILFETNRWLKREIIFENGYTTTIHRDSQLVRLIPAAITGSRPQLRELWVSTVRDASHIACSVVISRRGDPPDRVTYPSLRRVLFQSWCLMFQRVIIFSLLFYDMLDTALWALSSHVWVNNICNCDTVWHSSRPVIHSYLLIENI